MLHTIFVRWLSLLLALMILLTEGIVYAETDLNRNGLAAWWIGNGNESNFIEYMNGVDDIYTRVPNEVGIIMGNGLAEVVCGLYFDSWMDNMDGQSKYFSLFCDLIEQAYGTSSFDNTRVELIYSETYGWSENGDALTLCDEFYLFRMTYADGSWDDICVRMFFEIGQFEMIHGRLYNSFKVLSSEDEESQAPEDTSPLPDAIYYPEMYIVNCNEWVSLREHRDTSSRRLAKVPLGAAVHNCYESGLFTLCEYRGTYGYILSEYLSIDAPFSQQYYGVQVGTDLTGFVRARQRYIEPTICGASSYLVDDYGAYIPDYLFDNDKNTTWSEGASGHGIGQSVWATWDFQGSHNILTGLAIRNGFQKNTKTYDKNNRAEHVEFILNNRHYEALLLDYTGWQYIIFEEPFYIRDSLSMDMYINSVYIGNKHSDTCISEIDLLLTR